MSKFLKIKPVINSRNKQINLNFPRKQLPKKLKELLDKSPSEIKKFKIKLESWE